MFTFSKVMDQNIAPKIKKIKNCYFNNRIYWQLIFTSKKKKKKKKHSLKIICKSKHL